MSVETVIYAVRGVSIPYSVYEESPEKFDEHEDSQQADGIHVIVDSMSGSYMVVGKVLAECDQYFDVEQYVTELNHNEADDKHITESIRALLHPYPVPELKTLLVIHST